eukprot:scaffold10344_cov118-Isochrysis_galbana.AAC.2
MLQPAVKLGPSPPVHPGTPARARLAQRRWGRLPGAQRRARRLGKTRGRRPEPTARCWPMRRRGHSRPPFPAHRPCRSPAHAPSSYRWGAAPSSYRWGTVPPSYRWGAVPSSYRWGAVPPSYRWGAVPSSYRWGAVPPSYRWGTPPSSYRWGAVPSSYRWGAVPPSYRWGAVPSSYCWGAAGRLLATRGTNTSHRGHRTRNWNLAEHRVSTPVRSARWRRRGTEPAALPRAMGACTAASAAAGDRQAAAPHGYRGASAAPHGYRGASAAPHGYRGACRARRRREACPRGVPARRRRSSCAAAPPPASARRGRPLLESHTAKRVGPYIPQPHRAQSFARRQSTERRRAPPRRRPPRCRSLASGGSATTSPARPCTCHRWWAWAPPPGQSNSGGTERRAHRPGCSWPAATPQQEAPSAPSRTTTAGRSVCGPGRRRASARAGRADLAESKRRPQS